MTILYAAGEGVEIGSYTPEPLTIKAKTVTAMWRTDETYHEVISRLTAKGYRQTLVRFSPCEYDFGYILLLRYENDAIKHHFDIEIIVGDKAKTKVTDQGTPNPEAVALWEGDTGHIKDESY